MRSRVFKILVVASFFSILAFTCWAASAPIVLVEADPYDLNKVVVDDNDLTVTFNWQFVNFDGNPNWQVGEIINNSFQAFSGTTVTRNGGDIIDFAIFDSTNSTRYSLSEGIYAVNFTSPNSGFVQAPSYITQWYDDFTINWGVSTLSFEVVTSDGDPDGFAAVPIPASALLLGTGLIGLVGFRRRKVQS